MGLKIKIGKWICVEVQILRNWCSANVEAIGTYYLEVRPVSGHCKINTFLDTNARFSSIFKYLKIIR